MVAIVSGLQAGLELSSRAVLGQAGVMGNASEGRNGQSVYVNISTGSLVVQNQDDLLVSRGADHAVLRTYNSSGSLDHDNGDQWRADQLTLQLQGAVNTVGSTLYRYDRDGSAAAYTFDARRNAYVSSEGAGAFDLISYVAASNQFVWRDGATGATEQYEASGACRILSRSDTSGNTLTYAYAASGLLGSVTTSSGETVYYDYAGSNLTQVRTVSGATTTTRVRYAYDASNRLETVTVYLSPADNSVADGKTYQTRYTYDGSSKRIARITQSDGTALSIGYVDVGGGNHKVATIRDGLNQTTTFAYGDGYATVTDALNLTTRYEFDALGQLTRIVPPAVSGASATRQFAYASSGDVLSVTDGEGRTVSFEYDANGNQVLQRDQAGNTIQRTFDGGNQLLTETMFLVPDPDGAGAAQPSSPQTARYVYDATQRNQLRFVVSAEGNVTEHRYNGFGERTSTITYASGRYPVAALATQAAPAEAELVAWTSTQHPGATQRVDFGYDGRSRLQTRTTYANVTGAGDGIADGSSIERFVYDQAGRLLQTISPLDGATSFTYDGLNRVLTSTDALGQTTLTAYDDAAGKTSITLASGRVTTQSFDAAGRLVAVSESTTAGAALGESRYFYDAANRLRMTEDPTGVRSWMLYHESGLKMADIDGNGTLTEYVYDRSERLLATIQRGAAVHTGALMDASGMPLLSVDLTAVRPIPSPLDQTVWRQYDAAGRLVRVAEQAGVHGHAAVTETRYDGASRVVQVIRYATPIPTDGTVGTPAPGIISLPPASSDDRSTRFFHDADGRLVGTLDAEGYLTVSRYTPAGQLSERIAYANATDAALRDSGTLAQLQPAASPEDVRELTLYNGKGQVVGQLDGEGFLTENVYDANGQLSQSVRYATRVAVAVSASSTLSSIRPSASPEDRSTTRSYDQLGRILQETDAEGVVTQYSYDVAGNLTSTVKAFGTSEVRTLLARYDAQRRLAAELSAEGAAHLSGEQTQAQIDAIWAEHGIAHTYDAAGRRTSTVNAAGNKTLFYYDVDGALTHRINALGEVEETRYDARGRAVERIAYGTRIATTGLVGGLVPISLATTLDGIANTALDSRTVIAYARDGKVASTTDAVGTVTSSTFNAFGEETSRRLAGAGTDLLETYTVDRRGLRTKTVADEAQIHAVATAVYDAFGRMTRSVDANGNAREQAYDRLGRTVTVQDPLSATRVTSFDAFSRVLTSTDETGSTTTYAYDKAARTLRVTTPEGIVTTITHNRHGQVRSVTDGRQQTTTYLYDADGRLTTTRTPSDATATNVYDASGRLAEARDANGNRVSYTYDAADRILTRTVDPGTGGLNLTTTYAYDARGQRVSITDPNEVVTTIDYDLEGRVWKQTVDPTGLNLQTVFAYDGRGNTLTVTMPGGTVTRYVYDALGRRKQEIVDPGRLNLVRSWEYDKNGNVTSSTDANGHATRYVYDAGDRRVYTVNALGEVRQETYDAAGRVIRVTAYVKRVAPTSLTTSPSVSQIQSLLIADPTDAVEHSVYDKDGRLVTTVNGMGEVTRYAYDANGNVTSRIGHAGRIDLSSWVPGTLPVVVADDTRDQRVTTVYDAMNRARHVVDGTRALVSYRYDGNGNVIERIAYAKTLPPEVALTDSGITAAVPGIASTGVDAVARNTYDAANRLVTSVDGTGSVRKRIYYGENVVREIAYSTALPPNGSPADLPATDRDRVTSYAYDGAGRLTFTIDPTNAVVEYVRDAEGRAIREIAFAAPLLSPVDPQTAGAVASVRSLLTPDSARDRSTRHAFDAAGREVLTIDAEEGAVENWYDGAGNVVKRTVYATPVAASELASLTSTDSLIALVRADPAGDRSTRYAYDAAGRLAYEVNALGRVARSRYDGAGRLLEMRRFEQELEAGAAATVVSLDALAESATDRWERHAYDAAGHRLSTTDAMHATESWTYDGLGNRLTFVNRMGAQWTYAYDAAGRMTSEESPAVDVTTSTFDAATAKLATATATAQIIRTVLCYDALGNLKERTEASGRTEARTTQYEYDAAGRQIRVIFPPVSVYESSGDDVTANAGIAARHDGAMKSPETRTYYDALGNAVANRDVGGALSQKVYDPPGASCTTSTRWAT